MPRSISGSPARKRQRLSSPTYDDQVGDLTQEHLDAFDEIEARLSQGSQLPQHGAWGKAAEDGPSTTFSKANVRGKLDFDSSQPREPASSHPGFGFASARSVDLQDDPDNPFIGGFAPASKTLAPSFRPPTMGFASASALPLLREDYRSPSPEAPPEPDFDAWFNPAPVEALPVFQTAKFSMASDGMMGFTKASMKGAIVPTSEALAKARAKLSEWESEEDGGPSGVIDENATVPSVGFGKLDTQGLFKSAPSVLSPTRVALRAVENIVNTPGTPSPSGFSRPSIVGAQGGLQRPKAFKSPLIKNAHTPSHSNTIAGSPLNPHRPSGSLAFTTASFQNQHPLSSSAVGFSPATNNSPVPSSSFKTPLRQNTHPTPILRTRPAPFVTPFKAGMKPGEPGRSKLGLSSAVRTPQYSPKVTPARDNASWLARERPHGPQQKVLFSLTPQTDRQSLSSSGLQPQQYDNDQLESFGLNATMLHQITPETALYYSFHTTSSAPPSTFSAPSAALGPTEALKELIDRGCMLATKPWVDNHWCLVLWKLAGMVALDPEREKEAGGRRWCWAEVMRQLLYRYERELNTGIRPPLRKIATQDAPAAFPMVLCISNIIWSPKGITPDGLPIEPYPELEVTDGWYRLRAQVDQAMARAVRRGVVRVGRKIGVAGARLSTEKKDPSEILEAYNSTKLVLSGNSSHLVSWHAKLGFSRGPSISTLHSLTADGGVVAAMDLVIVKTHPIAFLESIEDEDGVKHREGPRNEADEANVNEQWKRRRGVAASNARAELEKDLSKYEGYIDRLERKAGSRFLPTDDDEPPNHIDALYDELEYPDRAAQVIARITPSEAGWLARHVRAQIEARMERMGDEIEQELKTLCPPREVRSFRMLIMQDARTTRRPANRTVQVTVWDVLNLQLAEGGRAGSFECGQRFLVTNLIPTQMGAWMDCEPGSEVYLSTRRDTRWTKIRTVGG
ncbi:hypothetical protein B0H34DRAFT_14333 [Crassisporium funariophilum]|nr:hypothetical protein B0H34DRAFT_14333 [Crassisporium funariophilum]